jgi:glycosyltransferase involved in cell wall biosynthesis
MKFVAILMVKNESRILRRCLDALVGVVDAFCIHDTGSIDDTRSIGRAFLENHKGCVTESEWKNFGESRTISFQAARDYVRDVLQWDLATTYGLLLDADMVFVPGKLRDQTLTEVGYSMLQCAGNLEYPNCRLVRMDYDWKCVGVTHEYWDGPTTRLEKDICYIDDRNDGGCKSDKFERDARLLEKGLEEDPTNGRYMFYLAQTYHSLGRWKDSIATYKKRIETGGWEEEIWYSKYMIGQCYQSLGDATKFEAWMLRAYESRPHRAEPLYKLAKYFREKSDHYKAFGYVKKGREIPLSNDSLFVEKNIYTGLFDYEATILHYYLDHPKSKGLEDSMRYLLTKQDYLDNVYNNMYFYIEPLQGELFTHPVVRDVHGQNFHPSSVSFFQYKGQYYHNVRFVNYFYDWTNGQYISRNGNFSQSNQIRTQNALWTPHSVRPMKDETVTLPRRNTNIIGLEDVRVYTNEQGALCFVATSLEYSEKPRIVHGHYNLDGTYSNCKVIQPPTDTHCEKNWLPVNNTKDILYNWHPLTIGSLEDDKLAIHTTHPTPWIFRHLRGSAVPFLVDDTYWCLVHFVEYSDPRKYYHCFVKLAMNYKPIAISLPFVFRKGNAIEYCLGCSQENEKIAFGFSTYDDNPCIMKVPMSDFQWLCI